MLLEGSCHCGAVRFSLRSHTPYPFMRCYCSICRKTDGGGGYAINIMGDAATLSVEGRDHVTVYHAREGDGESPAGRHFCKACGTHLYLADPRWPDWVYPYASAIDTALPTPPGHVNLMMRYAAGWADIPPQGPGEAFFDEYPEESIEHWHKARGLSHEG